MQSSLTERDYTSRRGELSAYGRAVNSARTLRTLIIAAAFISSALLLIAVFLIPTELKIVRVTLLLSASTLLLFFIVIWKTAREHFIDPDLAFRKWLQQVCDGELSARIDLPESHRHYKELNFHTRNLASSLRQLSTDMEAMVDTQTQRLEKQNRVLELLFQLTSDVAGEIELQSVLKAVCTHVANWQEGAEVAAYLLDEESASLKLKASSSADRSCFSTDRSVADLPRNAIAGAKSQSTVFEQINNEQQIIKVPIFKANQLVGMVEVVAAFDRQINAKESQRVLQTVSEQLTMFIAKESALESAQNARLIKERTQLGAEIHDSLAQTLLAARYQVSMLCDSLSNDSATSHCADASRIQAMIDEANEEVRGLIGEFRKPLTEHRYAGAIQKTIDDFNRSSQIEVFFQLDNPGIRFTAREDAVIERIVSEALVNAKKYSSATMIRVYIRDEASGARSVLIEDDGVGFNAIDLSEQSEGSGGNQIGLSIMRDRALSIGAIFSIDSEPGEGTRVFLKLPPLVHSEGA